MLIKKYTIILKLQQSHLILINTFILSKIQIIIKLIRKLSMNIGEQIHKII